MGQHYSIGFEGVELISGLDESTPVWLFMRGTVFKETDLATPLWTSDVGALPNDANRPIGGGIPIGDAGRFAEALSVGQRIENRSNWGLPSFKLDPAPLGPGEVLEVQVFMMPQSWFTTVEVPADEADAIATGVFLGLVGSVVGGPIAGLVTGVISGIFASGSSDTVEVPCLSTVVSARHVFTKADLDGMASTGQRRFGPRDNAVGAFCDPIDSFYWLSVNNAGWQFGAPTPVEAGPCQLGPRAFSPRLQQVCDDWGDVGNRVHDYILVWVRPGDGDVVEVLMREGYTGNVRRFENIPVELAVPSPPYVRNLYADPAIPGRAAKPSCPNCSHFTNLWLGFKVVPEAFLALAGGRGHLGGCSSFAETPGVPSGIPIGCGTSSGSLREYFANNPGDIALHGDSTLVQVTEDGSVAFWPVGSPPLSVLDPDESGLHELVTQHFDREDPTLSDDAGVSWMMVCDDVVLYSYAELRNGKPCANRLRYIRTRAGEIVTDAMLEGLPSIIR